MLSKDEGGRHTPFFNNYRPQFYFRTTDVTGSVELPQGTEMVMPGDNVKMNVELIAPIAMEQGLEICYKRRWANSWRRSCVKGNSVIKVEELDIGSFLASIGA